MHYIELTLKDNAGAYNDCHNEYYGLYIRDPDCEFGFMQDIEILHLDNSA